MQRKREIQENERNRDIFKKTRNIKGTLYERIGMIKDRNGMDRTEAEDIKKRWQEYTDVYKNVLMTWVTMKV